MKPAFIFIFSVFSFTSLYSGDQPTYTSLEERIIDETTKIEEAETKGASDLSLCYIDRAESYIIFGKYDQALDDLKKGYELAWQLRQRNVEQRALIDMMVTYAYLGDDENALSATEHFQNLFYSSDPHSRRKGRLCRHENYVSGPDDAPTSGWCRETVYSTGSFLTNLVLKSGLNSKTQETIRVFIDQIQLAGYRCCDRGERWKSCVGPLAKRALEWQISGVPEDPKWD